MIESFSKSKQRYITSRIENELNINLIQYLWNLIEEARKSVTLDYLQILNLTAQHNTEGFVIKQIILHSQEQPEYCKEYKIPIQENLIEDKIYIID